MRNRFPKKKTKVVVGKALKSLMENKDIKTAYQLSTEMDKKGLLPYDCFDEENGIKAEEKLRYCERSISNHLKDRPCSMEWLTRYQSYFECSYDCLLGKIPYPTHEITDIKAVTRLSEKSIEKLIHLNADYSCLLSAMIEHDDFVELMRAIDNKCNKKALAKMFEAATLFHVVEGAELTLTDSDSVKYQGNGQSMYLYDNPQDIETAIDLRINKLLYKIIDNIPNKKDGQ